MADSSWDTSSTPGIAGALTPQSERDYAAEMPAMASQTFGMEGAPIPASQPTQAPLEAALGSLGQWQATQLAQQGQQQPPFQSLTMKADGTFKMEGSQSMLADVMGQLKDLQTMKTAAMARVAQLRQQEVPCIVVGGELIPSMLELRLDEISGIYAAPLQMKANNGIFIIDDFGRQLMSPRDLLNRWIVPLDRRVDYLTLRYGVKFQIPFELMVVFSTNLDPSDLADEAFLRRIHNKIFVDAVTAPVFDQIFQRVVTSRNIPCQPDSA